MMLSYTLLSDTASRSCVASSCRVARMNACGRNLTCGIVFVSLFDGEETGPIRTSELMSPGGGGVQTRSCRSVQA